MEKRNYNRYDLEYSQNAPSCFHSSHPRHDRSMYRYPMNEKYYFYRRKSRSRSPVRKPFRDRLKLESASREWYLCSSKFSPKRMRFLNRPRSGSRSSQTKTSLCRSRSGSPNQYRFHKRPRSTSPHRVRSLNRPSRSQIKFESVDRVRSESRSPEIQSACNSRRRSKSQKRMRYIKIPRSESRSPTRDQYTSPPSPPRDQCITRPRSGCVAKSSVTQLYGEVEITDTNNSLANSVPNHSSSLHKTIPSTAKQDVTQKVVPPQLDPLMGEKIINITGAAVEHTNLFSESLPVNSLQHSNINLFVGTQNEVASIQSPVQSNNGNCIIPTANTSGYNFRPSKPVNGKISVININKLMPPQNVQSNKSSVIHDVEHPVHPLHGTNLSYLANSTQNRYYMNNMARNIMPYCPLHFPEPQCVHTQRKDCLSFKTAQSNIMNVNRNLGPNTTHPHLAVTPCIDCKLGHREQLQLMQFNTKIVCNNPQLATPQQAENLFQRNSSLNHLQGQDHPSYVYRNNTTNVCQHQLGTAGNIESLYQQHPLPNVINNPAQFFTDQHIDSPHRGSLGSNQSQAQSLPRSFQASPQAQSATTHYTDNSCNQNINWNEFQQRGMINDRNTMRHLVQPQLLTAYANNSYSLNHSSSQFPAQHYLLQENRIMPSNVPQPQWDMVHNNFAKQPYFNLGPRYFCDQSQLHDTLETIQTIQHQNNETSEYLGPTPTAGVQNEMNFPVRNHNLSAALSTLPTCTSVIVPDSNALLESNGGIPQNVVSTESNRLALDLGRNHQQQAPPVNILESYNCAKQITLPPTENRSGYNLQLFPKRNMKNMLKAEIVDTSLRIHNLPSTRERKDNMPPSLPTIEGPGISPNTGIQNVVSIEGNRLASTPGRNHQQPPTVNILESNNCSKQITLPPTKNRIGYNPQLITNRKINSVLKADTSLRRHSLSSTRKMNDNMPPCLPIIEGTGMSPSTVVLQPSHYPAVTAVANLYTQRNSPPSSREGVDGISKATTAIKATAQPSNTAKRQQLHPFHTPSKQFNMDSTQQNPLPHIGEWNEVYPVETFLKTADMNGNAQLSNLLQNYQSRVSGVNNSYVDSSHRNDLPAKEFNNGNTQQNNMIEEGTKPSCSRENHQSAMSAANFFWAYSNGSQRNDFLAREYYSGTIEHNTVIKEDTKPSDSRGNHQSTMSADNLSETSLINKLTASTECNRNVPDLTNRSSLINKLTASKECNRDVPGLTDKNLISSEGSWEIALSSGIRTKLSRIPPDIEIDKPKKENVHSFRKHNSNEPQMLSLTTSSLGNMLCSNISKINQLSSSTNEKNNTFYKPNKKSIGNIKSGLIRSNIRNKPPLKKMIPCVSKKTRNTKCGATIGEPKCRLGITEATQDTPKSVTMKVNGERLTVYRYTQSPFPNVQNSHFNAKNATGSRIKRGSGDNTHIEEGQNSTLLSNEFVLSQKQIPPTLLLSDLDDETVASLPDTLARTTKLLQSTRNIRQLTDPDLANDKINSDADLPVNSLVSNALTINQNISLTCQSRDILPKEFVRSLQIKIPTDRNVDNAFGHQNHVESSKHSDVVYCGVSSEPDSCSSDQNAINLPQCGVKLPTMSDSIENSDSNIAIVNAMEESDNSPSPPSCSTVTQNEHKSNYSDEPVNLPQCGVKLPTMSDSIENSDSNIAIVNAMEVSDNSPSPPSCSTVTQNEHTSNYSDEPVQASSIQFKNVVRLEQLYFKVPNKTPEVNDNGGSFMIGNTSFTKLVTQNGIQNKKKHLHLRSCKTNSNVNSEINTSKFSCDCSSAQCHIKVTRSDMLNESHFRNLKKNISIRIPVENVQPLNMKQNKNTHIPFSRKKLNENPSVADISYVCYDFDNIQTNLEPFSSERNHTSEVCMDIVNIQTNTEPLSSKRNLTSDTSNDFVNTQNNIDSLSTERKHTSNVTNDFVSIQNNTEPLSSKINLPMESVNASQTHQIYMNNHSETNENNKSSMSHLLPLPPTHSAQLAIPKAKLFQSPCNTGITKQNYKPQATKISCVNFVPISKSEMFIDSDSAQKAAVPQSGLNMPSESTEASETIISDENCITISPQLSQTNMNSHRDANENHSYLTVCDESVLINAVGIYKDSKLQKKPVVKLYKLDIHKLANANFNHIKTKSVFSCEASDCLDKLKSEELSNDKYLCCRTWFDNFPDPKSVSAAVSNQQPMSEFQDNHSRWFYDNERNHTDTSMREVGNIYFPQFSQTDMNSHCDANRNHSSLAGCDENVLTNAAEVYKDSKLQKNPVVKLHKLDNKLANVNFNHIKTGSVFSCEASDSLDKLKSEVLSNDKCLCRRTWVNSFPDPESVSAAVSNHQPMSEFQDNHSRWHYDNERNHTDTSVKKSEKGEKYSSHQSINESISGWFCSFCGGDGAFLCSQCFIVAYCGSQCAEKDWKEHHKICRKLPTRNPVNWTHHHLSGL